MLKDDMRDPAMSKPYSPAEQIGGERDYILARSCGRVHQGTATVPTTSGITVTQWARGSQNRLLIFHFVNCLIDQTICISQITSNCLHCEDVPDSTAHINMLTCSHDSYKKG